MTQRACVLAGTEWDFIELDKPMKCAHCGEMTTFIELSYLNFWAKAVCGECIKKEEEGLA